MTKKTFENVRTLKLIGTGVLKITEDGTLDGDIAHAGKDADGVLTVNVGEPPVTRRGGNYISGGNISNVSQGNVVGFNSHTITSSGISLSGTTARSGQREVTFGSKTLTVNAPTTDTLVINGVRFSVAALMAADGGAVPAPAEEALRVVYKLSAERTRIHKINIDDGVSLVIDNRSVLDETLRVSLSNSARVTLIQRHRFTALRVRAADAASFDGGKARVMELDVIATDAANVSRITVTRAGEAEASDAASVQIEQTAHNLVHEKRNDAAYLTVTTLVEAASGEKKRKTEAL